MLLLLKYHKNLLVVFFWVFKSSLRLYFDNILGFIVNKAVKSLNYYDLNGVHAFIPPTGLELKFLKASN